ncbi:MAG: hypothetical protein KF784_14060 [Fimbriimonadaceae bacterium]|nr:hypothetical protein [Fimbriimonadaceae bacterium]
MILHSFTKQDLKLRYMFLDLNAYFASVEQQMDPKLRGKPIAVSPVDNDSSCAIAASYEAKKFGVKTGTSIREARSLCPELIVVTAKHALYTRFHKAIVHAVNSVVPVEEVRSIDEMYCRLLGEEREKENAIAIAHKVKGAIHEQVGEVMHCSVGIGPNVFLAKQGTELQKPNGLVAIESSDLPDRLYGMALMDFTGINRRMKARLNAAGIFSAEQLCARSKEELRLAFGSIIGEQWWYKLRGYEIEERVVRHQSLSHSHVMAPEFRSDEGARTVLFRLLMKAAARLRSEGYMARGMSVWVRGKSASWEASTRFTATDDTPTFLQYTSELWNERTFIDPHQAGIVFYDLIKPELITPSLFDNTVQKHKLAVAVDKMNNRFGKNHVYVGSMERARDSAPERVAFLKTDLFVEGRGDHSEYDTLFPWLNDAPEIPELSSRPRGWATV